VTSQLTTAYPTTGAAQYSRRDYNYALYDSAVLTRTDFDIDTLTTTLPVTYSTYAIGAHGETLSATIQDGAPRTVTYVEDASGQVIRRRETSGTGAASTGTELSNNRWYRFAGVELFESGSATTGADGIASASYTVAAQIDTRQAEAKEAFALYRSAVFLAIGDAETALGTLQATRNRLAALEAQLMIERDSVRLAQQRYRMGLSDFLTVIDAQRQLNGTRQTLSDAQGNAGRGTIEVYRKFGGA
jgi:hypothetical protein